MQYPLSPDVKPEFCTTGTFMRLPASREGAKIAILGMPFDTAASFRVGARFAPQAVRQASSLLFPYNPVMGVYPFEDTKAIDVGDLAVIPHNITKSYEIMAEAAYGFMSQGIIPIAIGGDHSITLASLRAAAKAYGPVAMVHFDSHTDTWDTYYGEKYWHGSPFVRAYEEGLLQPSKVFQIGIRGTLNHPGDFESATELGYNVITTCDLRRRGTGDVVKEVKERIGQTPVFLTFDIDFVDPAFAPGTGTPEVGGYSSAESLEIVRALDGLNYIGFDVVEVLPSYDPTGMTSLLAATLMHEFGSHVAANLRQSR